jgi:hypothetical protein
MLLLDATMRKPETLSALNLIDGDVLADQGEFAFANGQSQGSSADFRRMFWRGRVSQRLIQIVAVHMSVAICAIPHRSSPSIQ